MGLTEKEVAQIRKELDDCVRPLYFFHDDSDGLCSFLLLYKYVKDGKGVVIKARPRISEDYLRKVEENQPDKIFIVDIAIVDQEFIDAVKVPIVWIDHHTPLDRHGIKYFNPRLHSADDNIPASYLCHQATRDNLWVAFTGCVGDWYLPMDLKDEFISKYPKLLSPDIMKPDDALFESDVGKLARIFNFILKGKTSEALKCARILTRVDDPAEILEQTTPRGKYIYRYYERINREYEVSLNEAKKAIKKQKKEKVVVVEYVAKQISFTGDISNELLHLFPDKVIIITREKDGEMKSSLRSPKDIILSDILPKALFGVEGYGGGHEHACGACVKKEDWEQFLDNLKEEIEKTKE
jgi:single-stranded DNA-specific DHH superfamily exonuclease